jgi:pimeloyl-ACP methyl ester carboxylesterase
MRAGLELYRTFDTDDEHNTSALKALGKLKIPVLAVGGEISTFGPLMGDMMKEVADKVTDVRVPRTAHFVAEENLANFAEELLKFIAT